MDGYTASFGRWVKMFSDWLWRWLHNSVNKPKPLKCILLKEWIIGEAGIKIWSFSLQTWGAGNNSQTSRPQGPRSQTAQGREWCLELCHSLPGHWELPLARAPRLRLGMVKFACCYAGNPGRAGYKLPGFNLSLPLRIQLKLKAILFCFFFSALDG